MTTFTYSLTFTDNHGRFHKVGVGTEEEMFFLAVEIDKRHETLESAVREVWNVENGIVHLVKIQPYKMGKPTDY